jgi:hypothetical protein
VWRECRRGIGDQKDDDDAACNPHAVLSTILFIFNSSMLFDDAACNPHAVSSIYFYFYFFYIVWWCGVPPTHLVVYFYFFLFLLCCLTMWCATYMLHCLFIFIFISSMLFDDMACNPHASSSIYFYFYTSIY